MSSYEADTVQRLKTRLGRKSAERRTIAENARRENRGDQLTVEQESGFRALSGDIEPPETRIEEIEEEDRRSIAATEAMRRAGASSGSGSRSQVYGPESRASYSAIATRQAKSIAVISGTGLTPPVSPDEPRWPVALTADSPRSL